MRNESAAMHKNKAREKNRTHNTMRLDIHRQLSVHDDHSSSLNVKLFPDPSKFPSLHLSHCILSPHAPPQRHTEQKLQQKQAQKSIDHDANDDMKMTDDINHDESVVVNTDNEPSQQQQQQQQEEEQVTTTSGQWFITVILNKVIQPVFLHQTSQQQDSAHLSGRELFPIMSCHPIISYNQDNQPVLRYRKQSHVIGLSSDLLLMDRMQYVALQLMQLETMQQQLQQHSHTTHHHQHMFKIKYLSHSLIAISFGFEFEFDAYITYSIDDQLFKVQFSPSLYELVPLIEFQLNQSYAAYHNQRDSIDMMKRFLSTLNLVCAPMLLMKQVVSSHEKKMMWTIIPRSLVHWRMLYINNKYEFSVHVLPNGRVKIAEVAYQSTNSPLSVKHKPFQREASISNILGDSSIDGMILKREYILCVEQMRRYAISLEVFNLFCTKMISKPEPSGTDTLSVTFNIHNISYNLYVTDEIQLRIVADPTNVLSDEEGQFITQKLFKEKVADPICNAEVSSVPYYSPISSFDGLVLKLNVNATKQVLQTLMDHQRENNKKENEGDDDIILVMDDMISNTQQQSLEKKKTNRLLYCDVLFIAPAKGLHYPKRYNGKTPSGEYLIRLSDSRLDVSLVLRFAERNSINEHSKFVDVPLAIKFDGTFTSNQVSLLSVGKSMIAEIASQQPTTQNLLYAVVDHLCHMTLDEVYNLE